MKVRFSQCALLLLVAVPLGGTRVAGQPKTTSARKVEVVATLPTPGRTENICEGPDGSIYVTGSTDKILWKISGGRLTQFASFPSLAGIGGVVMAEDGFVLTATAAAQPGTAPASGAAPAATSELVVLDKSGKITAEVPGMNGQRFNGIARARKGVYLIADSTGQGIWQFDLASKRIELWLKDDLLYGPPTDTLGANGMKVHNGWAYVAVTGRRSIYRVEIGPDGRPKGKLSVVTDAFRPDDFDVAKDGTIYGIGAGTPDRSVLADRRVLYKVSPTGEATKFVEDVPHGPAVIVTADGKWVYWSSQGDPVQQVLRVATR